MPARIKTHKPISYVPLQLRRKAHDRERGTRTQRGYSNRWLAYSKDRLKRYPWCAAHRKQGLFVSATETDHRTPVDGPEDPLFWDETNHQSLCHACHSSKTAREDGGFVGRGRQRRGRGGSKVLDTSREPSPQPNLSGRDMFSGGGLNPQGGRP